MRKIVLSFITLLGGCNYDSNPPDAAKGILTNQTITVSGTQRNYHLFIPDNPINSPIVFLFHGNGGNYDDLLGFSNLKAPYKIWLDIAKQENLILIIPNGSPGSTSSRGWNDCRNDAPTNPSTNDIQFIVNLLNFVEVEYNLSSSKVFAVGTSNGGHFAIRLAHEIPNRITAFAAIVAANAVNSKCPASTLKVSALFMNGTDDPIMPYNGGQMASNRGEVFSTEATVSYWVQRNALNPTPEITNIVDANTSDNSTIIKYLYKNGAFNTEVALYKIDGGGHTEPSIAQRYSTLFLLAVGNQNGDIEMAQEIWSFFKTK
jgi:polyhydroxybutyrate depolymerase